MSDTAATDDNAAIPIHLLSEKELESWLAGADVQVRAWVEAHDFKAEPGKHLIVPGADGKISSVLAGVSSPVEIWDVGALPGELPTGSYAVSPGDLIDDSSNAEALMLGWILGSYSFDTYKAAGRPPARLVPPDAANAERVRQLGEAIYLARDLINTPANDLGPEELAVAARNLADRFGASFQETAGPDLLRHNYPAIHAVGRAAAAAPRLIEMVWGDAKHPTVALVGKGVCFDSGGLDIKPASGMKLMKKDMGGAAHVLGLASAIMAAALPIRLVVLVPAVENAISGDAMRPLDVVRTRAGITVEIGNTDAEGRVILADALSRASEHDPDVIIDFATLTGAARVALGTELPALFCNEDGFAEAVLAAGTRVSDPLWRMPLWPGYRSMIKGKVADITNAPEGGYAGAITAALFLERFVPDGTPWAHIDVMAWNTASKPGRPEGGEAMGLRAFFDALRDKYTAG